MRQSTEPEPRAQVQASLVFPWPADVVWPYLIPLEQVPRWEDDVLEVRLETPGVPAVGSRLSARRIYAGHEARLEGTVTALDPGRSATIELEAARWPSHERPTA